MSDGSSPIDIFRGVFGKLRKPTPQNREDPTLPTIEATPTESSEAIAPTPKTEGRPKPEIPTPGEAPIPEGNIRLFHFTYPDKLPSIQSQGIISPKVEVNENGYNTAPNSTWIYSDLNINEPPGWTIGKPYIEFSASLDQMGPHNAVAKEGTARTLNPEVDIPLEKIVAIHEPWHEMVRHAKDGVIEPDWLKTYTDRSVQVAGMHGTRGNYTDYSQMASQRKYLESQLDRANKYLALPT